MSAFRLIRSFSLRRRSKLPTTRRKKRRLHAARPRCAAVPLRPPGRASSMRGHAVTAEGRVAAASRCAAAVQRPTTRRKKRRLRAARPRHEDMPVTAEGRVAAASRCAAVVQRPTTRRKKRRLHAARPRCVDVPLRPPRCASSLRRRAVTAEGRVAAASRCAASGNDPRHAAGSVGYTLRVLDAVPLRPTRCASSMRGRAVTAEGRVAAASRCAAVVQQPTPRRRKRRLHAARPRCQAVPLRPPRCASSMRGRAVTAEGRVAAASRCAAVVQQPTPRRKKRRLHAARPRCHDVPLRPQRCASSLRKTSRYGRKAV